MKSVRLIITGDVQGVGFRGWAKNEARALGLTGWVKNREDGAVEIIAEGQEKNLEEFARGCKRGPEVAWVQRVEVAWGQATGKFLAFEVLY